MEHVKDLNHETLNHETIAPVEEQHLDDRAGDRAREQHSPDHSQLSFNKRKLVIVLTALLVVAAGSIFLWARHEKSVAGTTTAAASTASGAGPAQPGSPDIASATQEQLRQITVEPVTERALGTERETTGKVTFNEERMTPVFSPYAGRIMELRASKGEVVKQGQPLLVIESPELVSAQNDLASARSDENRARIALDIAQKTADRARGLHEHEALATKDLQQAESDLARATDDLHRSQAAVAFVESRLALFGRNAKELAEVSSREGGGPDRRVVTRAPITGTIVERKVGLGQYIKPDLPDPLFMISDLSTVWVMADVYESDLSKIHIGQPVEITVPAYPGRVFPAHISFINPTLDPATRTIHVRCLVQNPSGLLKPDMFAKIKIGAASPLAVRVVPSGAVMMQGTDPVVFVEEGPGRFRRKVVKTGRDVEGFTVIEDGLKAGDRVATRGVLLLNGLTGGQPAGDGGEGKE